MYLDEEDEAGEILSRLEMDANSDLIVDADGVWRWKPYSPTATPVRAFVDRDYLPGSWRVVRDPRAAWSTTRLKYAHRPNRSTRDVLESQDTSVPVRLGPIRTEEFVSYVNDAVVAAEIPARIQEFVSADPRIVEFDASAKAIDLEAGDIITVTRERALDPTGAFDAVRFRVRGLRHDFLSGVSHVTAVEDVSATV